MRKQEQDHGPNGRPPRDHLFRAVYPGVELRAADDGEDGGPTMIGHFAVFNEWTEIHSIFEGDFLERFVPGAFKKTIRENRDGMRVLFQHGFDYSVGDKPLGPIEDLREDAQGAYYEVPLLDASYVRDEILPGLEAGLYGASMRFRVMREEFVEEPGSSDHNPGGLPERTVKEAQVREFGPVTFPAYAGASAGVRSLSDEFVFGRFARNPERLRELVGFLEGETSSPPGAGAEPQSGRDAPADDAEREEPAEAGKQDKRSPKDGAGAEPHPDHGSRGKHQPLYGQEPRKEKPSWLL
jgi:hypothetical protein